MYLYSSSIHIYHDVWMIDLGAYIHMTTHREWFYEYETYDRGDVFLGDDLTYRIK